MRRDLWPLLLLCVGFGLFSLGNTVVFILEVVALFLLLLVYFVRNPPDILKRSGLPFQKGHLPLFLFCLGLVMFAAIPLVTSTFRAPGRFIWPVYYLFYLGLMVFLFRRFSPRVVTALLLTGLAVQVADLKVNRPFRSGQTTFTSNLKSGQWAEVVRPFTTLAVIPPFEPSVGGKNDYVDFSFLASRQGKKVTTGALVRIPGDLERVTQEVVDEALSGPRDTDTLYVFGANSFADTYKPKLEPGLRCTKLDAYLACHSACRPAVRPVR